MIFVDDPMVSGVFSSLFRMLAAICLIVFLMACHAAPGAHMSRLTVARSRPFIEHAIPLSMPSRRQQRQSIGPKRATPRANNEFNRDPLDGLYFASDASRKYVKQQMGRAKRPIWVINAGEMYQRNAGAPNFDVVQTSLRPIIDKLYRYRPVIFTNYLDEIVAELSSERLVFDGFVDEVASADIHLHLAFNVADALRGFLFEQQGGVAYWPQQIALFLAYLEHFPASIDKDLRQELAALMPEFANAHDLERFKDILMQHNPKESAAAQLWPDHHFPLPFSPNIGYSSGSDDEFSTEELAEDWMFTDPPSSQGSPHDYARVLSKMLFAILDHVSKSITFKDVFQLDFLFADQFTADLGQLKAFWDTENAEGSLNALDSVILNINHHLMYLDGQHYIETAIARHYGEWQQPERPFIIVAGFPTSRAIASALSRRSDLIVTYFGNDWYLSQDQYLSSMDMYVLSITNGIPFKGTFEDQDSILDLYNGSSNDLQTACMIDKGRSTDNCRAVARSLGLLPNYNPLTDN